MTKDEEVQQVQVFLKKHQTTKEALEELNDAWQKLVRTIIRESHLCKLARKINTLLGIKNA